MARRGWFFAVRVTVLGTILFGVILYAVRDFRARSARNAWQRPLDVAVVVVQAAGAGAVDPAAAQGLRDRAPALEARLAAEHRRHAPGSPLPAPFHFQVFGVVPADQPAPAPAGEGFVDAVSYALALRRWVSAVDARAGIPSAGWDARIYVVARRPEHEERSMVEGRSEHGGWVGLVEVELDPEMVDVTHAVVAHELMHVLGAEDAYDAAGLARIPEGLAEPERVPLYPQRFAEVMARGRPVSPGREVLPETLDEIAVGAVTARAIGWTQ